MKQRAAAVVLVLFILSVIGQSVCLASQADVNPFAEPMISPVTAASDISAAHITEPVSLPAVHKYKAAIPHILKKAIVYRPAPIAYSFHFPPPNVAEAFGFLKARKFQANYLS